MKIIHHYVGFETYKKENHVLYCRDCAALDWYELADNIEPAEDVVHLLVADSMICATAKDHTRLYPAGFDLLSVKVGIDDDAPERGQFVDIQGGELSIVAPPPHIVEARANNERARLMSLAGERIAPLKAAQDLGVATEDELAALTAWQGFLIALMRLPQSEGWPMEMQWPTLPESEVKA